MLKVLREILIYILLIALIVLVFGIIFYDHLPSNKLVPGEVEVALPEKLEEELEQTLAEDEQKEVIVTYTVEESDLDRYEDINKYDPGKVNPFSDYNGENVNTNTGTLNNNSGNTGGNNSSSSQGGTSSSTNTGSSGSGQLTETKPGK